MTFDLEKTIAKMKLLTCERYNDILEELIDYILALPDGDIKKHMIVCQEKVYKECKKIGDYFKIKTNAVNHLPEDVLCVCVNVYEIEKPFIFNEVK